MTEEVWEHKGRTNGTRDISDKRGDFYWHANEREILRLACFINFQV